MAITTCIFDSYGTLFDVTAAARAVAREPGREAFAERWPQVAENWRRKQLQYTWLRTITGEHADFRQLTRDGLEWALEAAGLADPELGDRLLALYHELAAYPEVAGVLGDLKKRGLSTAILSNGTPEMLRAAVSSAGLGALFDDLLSVEAVGVFKPHPRVYDMVGARFGCAPTEVLFVSANGWDVAGAAGYGFATVWVNRSAEPVDRLPGRPTHVLPDLSVVPDLVQAP